MGGEETGESQGQRKKEAKISFTFGLEEAFFFNSLAKIQAEHSSSLKILFCYQVYLATSEDLAVHSPGRINTCLDCIQGKKKSKPSLNEELIVVCITSKAGVLVHLETTTHMLL